MARGLKIVIALLVLFLEDSLYGRVTFDAKLVDVGTDLVYGIKLGAKVVKKNLLVGRFHIDVVAKQS